jgi:hypothetical protein
MTWQEHRRQAARALALAAALAAGCSAAEQAPPAQYGYGDMFRSEGATDTTTASTGYPGGGGGADGEMMMAEEVAGESMPAPPPAPERRRFFGGHHREAPPPPPAPVMAAPPSDQPAPQPGNAATTPAAPTTVEGGQGQAGTPEETGSEPASGERRAPMLIYEADLTLATRTVREQIDEAVRITREMGGIIVSQDDTGVVVRVPAPRFREALGQFEALGDVVARRVTARDVAEVVRDTRVRLQNARNMRDRLRELLRQATTVPESLAIERELERLNETIALLEGQLEALEERISYSTVTLRFQAVQDTSEVPNALFRLPFDWLDQIGLPNLLSL